MLQDVFTERFNEARKENKVTLRELSAQTGISASAMGHYSRGSAIPTLEGAALIADALDVSLDWLCGLIGQRKPLDNNYRTYGEVARDLYRMTETPFLSAIYSVGEDSDTFFSICHAPELRDFFSKAKKLEPMLRSGDDDAQKMAKEWAEARLLALDKIEIIPTIGTYLPPEEE